MPRPSRATTSRRCGSATCSACPPGIRPSRRARRIEPWTKTFLAHPVPFKPGTHFLYNTSATYMLSAIVQKATGMTVLDYLRPRLFEPLGIEHPTWETSPQGISTGGYGLSIRTEDIARFGQLYLQKGKWQGKQLVPAAWVEAATARQTSNGSNPKSDWDQGYGYQFWRCRHGAYRGDGAFGQYCIVLPEQDAVIAITSGVKDMQAVLNLVWDKLLPAMKSSPLAADDEARKKLEHTLKGLSLRPQEGSGSPAKVSGKKYVFPANERKLEAITLESDGKDGAVTLVTRFDGVEQRIACGRGAWQKGRVAWGSLPEQPAAASGAWTADDTFTAKLCFYETPFIVTVTLEVLRARSCTAIPSRTSVSGRPRKHHWWARPSDSMVGPRLTSWRSCHASLQFIGENLCRGGSWYCRRRSGQGIFVRRRRWNWRSRSSLRRRRCRTSTCWNSPTRPFAASTRRRISTW